MKNLKKIISFVLSAVFAFGGATAVSAKDDIYVSETFDNCITNSSYNGLDISGAESNRIVDLGYRNKGLILNGKSTIDVKKAFSADTKELTAAVDIKAEGDGISGEFGVYDDNSSYAAITVTDNVLYAPDGRKIGELNSKSTTKIFVMYDLNSGRYSVGAGGRTYVKYLKTDTKFTPAGVYIKKKVSKLSGDMVIDNLLVYSGMTVKKNIGNSLYKDNGYEYFDTSDQNGDYQFFDSNFINVSRGTYEKKYFNAVPKDNVLTCAAYDYKNKNRDSYICFEKNTDNDVYFDVDFTEKNKIFRYYIIESDFMFPQLGAQAIMCILRDRRSFSANQTDWFSYLSEDGALTFSSGLRVEGIAKPGQWFNLKYSVDIAEHTADVYCDNVLIAEKVPFSENIVELDMIRTGLDSGKTRGKMYVQNYSVTGLVKPFSLTADYRTDIFRDDTPTKEYLRDKLVFNYYADSVVYKGERLPLKTDMVFENDEVYVEKNELLEYLKMFGEEKLNNTNISQLKGETVSKDGHEYVPVSDFAENVMGLNTYFNKHGYIIVSENALNFDTENEYDYYILKPVDSNNPNKQRDPSVIEEIGEYSFYERPSAEKIEEIYKTQGKAGHPRLFADNNDFLRLRELKNTNSDYADLVNRLIYQADQILPDSLPLVDYNYTDPMRMLNDATKFNDRMEYLGFAYQMTGDKKYFERAWKEMNNVAGFPDLNPNHIIDSGMFMCGLAIGYDFFYETFSAEQRKIMRDAIDKLVFKQLGNGYYGRLTAMSWGSNGWDSLREVSNFNAFENGGMFLCALALIDEEPEICSDMLRGCLRSTECLLRAVEPDGGWNESPTYWEHVTHFLCNDLAALDNVMGTDFGISKYRGLNRMSDYMIGIDSEISGINNLHDCNASPYYTRYQYSYLGKKFNRPDVSALRKYVVCNPDKFKTELDIFDAIFFDAEVSFDEMQKLPTAMLTKGTETFGIRKCFGENNDVFLSAHAGPVSGFHTHNDAGTFVYDILGQRWAIDLGMEDYNLTNVSGVRTEDTYRRRTEGHNTLVINPNYDYNQTADTFAEVTDFAENEWGGYAIMDMSDIYKDASSVRRGLYLGDSKRSLTVRDEIELDKESTVYWFMNTRADVAVTDDGAVLSQNGKSMKLNFKTNAAHCTIESMEAKPLDTSPQPEGQNPNSGVQRVTIKLSGSGKINLTVQLVPLGEETAQVSMYDVPLDNWSLQDKAYTVPRSENFDYTVYIDGQPTLNTTAVSLHADGTVPDVSVVPANPAQRVEVKNAKSAAEKTVVNIYSSDNKYYTAQVISFSDFDRELQQEYNIIGVESLEVSSTPEAENSSVNLTDMNFNTRWTCMKKGEYVLLDFGKETEISGIAAAFWKGNERKYYYEIQVSSDGENYTTVKKCESSGMSNRYEIADFETVSARYVKIVCNGNNLINNPSSVNTNILELRTLKRK